MEPGIPKSRSEWIDEIAEAYHDAKEAIPFGKFIGEDIGEKDLFQIAPDICLKFRGIKRAKATLEKVTKAALSSYVATKDLMGDLLEDPHLSFAFCYLASHFALGLVDELQADEIMTYIEANQEQLEKAVSKND